MEDRSKLVGAAIRRLEILGRTEAFDPINPDSRPTAAQQQVIDDFGKIRTQWIVAATQSGKSQTCARLVAWAATNTHPTWKKPDEWGAEPLLILVAGRTGKQIEESLLPKIRGYLEPGTFKEVRIGNIIQRLELSDGTRFVFQSLENPGVARERIQSYVAHIAWIDEMPATSFIVDEIQRRVQARNGYFLASFTPLVINEDIRKMVDSAVEPYAKKYKFTMFDNPLYASNERRAEIIASMMSLPESVRNTRLFGEWSVNDDAVYYFNYDKMVSMPSQYSPLWRHVESVDPALKSALGLTVWAESPSTKQWYCVMAEYVKGIQVPTDLVKAVREKTKHLNIIRRIADPHEVWYIQTAASMGIHYMGVYKKNERKGELIKGLQEKLGGQICISTNCPDLISEFQECRWSDKASGRIINASSYHLLDSAQYFADNIPKPETEVVASNWDEWLYKKNDERKLNVEKQKLRLQKKAIRRSKRWS
jgi:hypothetical protein